MVQFPEKIENNIFFNYLEETFYYRTTEISPGVILVTSPHKKKS